MLKTSKIFIPGGVKEIKEPSLLFESFEGTFNKDENILSLKEMVIDIASKAHELNENSSLEDLISAGMLGVTIAANKYSSMKEGKILFEEYAFIWAKKFISDEVQSDNIYYSFKDYDDNHLNEDKGNLFEKLSLESIKNTVIDMVAILPAPRRKVFCDAFGLNECGLPLTKHEISKKHNIRIESVAVILNESISAIKNNFSPTYLEELVKIQGNF